MGHVLNQTSRFEVMEYCLATHELLLLRDRAGLPVHGLDDSCLPAKPLLSLCIRERSGGENLQEGQLVALALVRSGSATEPSQEQEHYLLQDFLVLPEFRHLGLGSFLLETVIERLSLLGAPKRQLMLDVLPGDEVLAQRLGFKPGGHSVPGNLWLRSVG
ncbi:GNAT family N-acetyltransferase [Shewanella algae]|uniref:GNAT family N-acetyltransferase n=1 Tax=Shewanella algae TaxID=38313 RepID=UPI001AAD05F9|nr:GNAT family N-acetyltransferase [Shewanella algae]MBO2564667.1 GNAT family N-acetyltransferase [Shewanella algae]